MGKGALPAGIPRALPKAFAIPKPLLSFLSGIHRHLCLAVKLFNSILEMAIPHTMEEEDGIATGHEGDNLHLEAVVPEDVQAVMSAAEDGDAQALSTALGSSHAALSRSSLPYFCFAPLRDLGAFVHTNFIHTLFH